MKKTSPPQKECKKCKEYFALNNFSKKRGKYTSICLPCERKRGQKYYKNNKEKINSKHKEYAK